jgi:hypothetical protein
VIFRKKVLAAVEVSLPLAFSRAQTLTITATPGPQPIASAVPGSADPRSVSISVTNLAFLQR